MITPRRALVSALRRLDRFQEKRRLRKWAESFKASVNGRERPLRLHLGSGPVKLSGWLNLDFSEPTCSDDLQWDLRFPIPLEDQSCSLIYSEHVLEHFPVQDGVRLLQDCWRLLVPGGVLRCAMPSLDHILERVASGLWRDQDWLSWPEYRHVETRAEMLNMVFRGWDHQWLYDTEELHRRLRGAGFTKLESVGHGQSSTPELRGLETRADSKLISEAVKEDL